MKISPEKLAQIAAGADPKTVLTAEEFTLYTAELEAEPAAEEAEAAESTAEEPEASAEPSSTMSADYANLLKENGKLEAKLEAAAADNAALKQSLEGRDVQMASLLTVAQAAVGNLQTALGRPKEAKSSAAEVVAQYNELQGDMAKRFKVGQQTQTPTEDTTSAQVTTSFRHN